MVMMVVSVGDGRGNLKGRSRKVSNIRLQANTPSVQITAPTSFAFLVALFAASKHQIERHQETKGHDK
jgi:hypothetical protein